MRRWTPNQLEAGEAREAGEVGEEFFTEILEENSPPVLV
jgi:hypothetical protein